MFKKALCCVLAFVVCFSMFGCSNDDSDTPGVVTPSNKEEDNIDFVSKPVAYEFPKFLEETDRISQFSRLVYESFNYAQTNTVKDEVEVTDDGYRCDMSFLNGKLLRFMYDGKYGIVDNEGNIKLQGIYTSVLQIRPELFELEYNDEKTYATLDENNDFVFVEDDSFNWVFEKNKLEITQSSIEAGENTTDVSEGFKYLLKTPDGKTVYDRSFDSIAETSKDNFDIECESLFTAYSGGSYYIIVFDEFYNYSVYEGNYGTVDVSINEDNGSCYILNYDHYVQILSLFSSFDFNEAEGLEASENSVFLDFSVSKNSQSKYLICDNGYCEITSLGEDGAALVTNKYKVSDECFADVVKWIDLTLSSEYSD